MIKIGDGKSEFLHFENQLSEIYSSFSYAHACISCQLFSELIRDAFLHFPDNIPDFLTLQQKVADLMRAHRHLVHACMQITICLIPERKEFAHAHAVSMKGRL